MTAIASSADRELPMIERVALRRAEYVGEFHFFQTDPETLDHQTDDEVAAGLAALDAELDDIARERVEKRERTQAREVEEAARLAGPVTDRTIFDISYVNEHGRMDITAEFDLAAATRMASTLYGVASWGRVSSVTITRSERARTY